MTYTRTRTSFAWLAAPTLALGPPAAAQDKSAAPALAADVTFYGSSSSPISSGVIIPPGRASIWVSGTVPPVI